MPALTVKNAVNALWRGLKSAGGVTVSYRAQGSPDVLVANLDAIPGETRTETAVGEVAVSADRLHDFVVRVQDLGQEPEIGDLITWDGRDYEVRGDGVSRHYDEIDRHKILYRIHTKEVS
jgi:hypothetical protein